MEKKYRWENVIFEPTEMKPAGDDLPLTRESRMRGEWVHALRHVGSQRW